MITYTYECQVCSNRFDIEQSIKDKPLTLCTCCSQHRLERVIYGGAFASVNREATTIGQLADRNAKKFGKGKVQDMEAERPKFKQDENRNKMNKILAGGKDRIQKYITEGK